MNKNHATISTYNNQIQDYVKILDQFDKEQQSVILKSIGDGVIATDLNGNVKLMNAVAEKLTGWKFDHAENKPITEVLQIINKLTREQSPNPIQSVLSTGKSLKLAPNTVLISHNSKKEYSISDSCAPIIDKRNKMMGAVLVFRDVTEQKREEALNAVITADLIQRNKDHEHFSSIISHDLRGPVANILSLTSVVNGKGLTKDEKAFIMNALTVSAERLNEVIVDLNTILNVGKQLSEKREQIRFSKLVSDIQFSISDILKKEKANFSVDFSIVDKTFAIKSYIYSIFYNLISNSIKYRRPDVPLDITIKSRLEDKKIILTFKDNGLGIDLDTIGHHMFKLYKRFHINKAEGKGMGLYMVKMQVEKIGGTINVESKVNQGTQFTISLNA